MSNSGRVTGVTLGIAAVLILGATSVLVALSMGTILRAGIAALAVAAYVIAFSEVVLVSLFLSPFDAFTRGAVLTALVVLFFAAFGIWMWRGMPRTPRLQLRRATPIALVALFASTVLALAYMFVLLVGTPPNGWDPLNYHLPRAAFWMQSHHVGYIADAYDERLNFNPPNAEIGVSVALTIARNERAAGFVQFFAWLACGAGVFVFAQRLGRSAAEALFGALLFILTPIVLLQSSGAKNDLVVASFLLAAAVFVLGRTTAELAIAALATALAVGAKFTATYGLVILAVLAFVAPPHSTRWRRYVALAVGGVFGSYWYIVNEHATGRFLGDQSETGRLTATLDLKPNLVTLYGDALDTLDLSGARGDDALYFVVAAVVVAAGLVFARFRRRSAFAAGALVACALLILPLASLGRSGFVHLYDALGKPPGYLAIGDAITTSPTLASDTGSWFGPAALLLVAVTLAARGALSRLALVAALAPAAWLVLVAVTLTYHPWQGRFFIFPVALSAALWGLVLRWRALAWSVVALAVTTAALSLAHYEEKPARQVWGMPRWELQSRHDPPLVEVWRYLDEQVPQDASIAVMLGPNEFGFPPFGQHLTRRIRLKPTVDAEWLFADAHRAPEVDRACWTPRIETVRGVVYQRTLGCS